MIPPSITEQIKSTHASWHTILQEGLKHIDPDYLNQLATDDYLPKGGRLFAAFTLPINQVKYVLVGEGPYPREESATGVCFMDGAVRQLWSDKGLSKQANRATSLRNFIKMLLVADNQIDPQKTSGDALLPVAQIARQHPHQWVQSCQDLQHQLLQHGFLLLNASLVFRSTVKPVKDARAWQPFFDFVLHQLSEYNKHRSTQQPTFILWGKLAEQLASCCQQLDFPFVASEHPYNISFIQNSTMQNLFRPMHLLMPASA